MGEIHQEIWRRQAGEPVELPGLAALVTVDAIDQPVGLLLGSSDPLADPGLVVLVEGGSEGKFLVQDELLL